MLEVKIEGTKQLQDLLIKLGNDLESNLQLNKELSSNLSQKASSIAPRLTGALASSIVGNPSPQKAQIAAGSAAVPYAGVIEYGWPARNIQAQPYLNKTVNSNMGYIIEAYNQSINENIKKYNLD
jgi:phage gpG-like protein